VDRWEVEIEPSHTLGLPVEVLAKLGLEEGGLVQIDIQPDKRLRLIPIADLLAKFSGAIPGLAAATAIRDMRGPLPDVDS
jgi:hypothetical protein